MSRQFPVRRVTALITSVALLASLAVVTVAAPAAAGKPKCDGKTATIVGTKKGEVIRGTRKADVIVARGGNDRVYGRGGNDRICGGAGRDRLFGHAGQDRLYGNAGPDRLFGGPGPDVLKGQVGNDALDGGIGADTCLQGTGTGPQVRCASAAAPTPTPTPAPTPPAADLAVQITTCINCTISGQNFGVDVKVTNNGPSAVPYVLSHQLDPVAGWVVGVDVTCTTTTDASGPQPALAAGKSDDFSYVAKCTDLRDTNTAGIEVVFAVHVAHAGPDVPDTNNTDLEQQEVRYPG
jgi:hypothetical protein